MPLYFAVSHFNSIRWLDGKPLLLWSVCFINVCWFFCSVLVLVFCSVFYFHFAVLISRVWKKKLALPLPLARCVVYFYQHVKRVYVTHKLKCSNVLLKTYYQNSFIYFHEIARVRTNTRPFLPFCATVYKSFGYRSVDEWSKLKVLLANTTIIIIIHFVSYCSVDLKTTP